MGEPKTVGMKRRRAKKPTLRELRRLQDPYVTVEYAGRCFDMGKTQSYDSVRAGTFPVQVIRRGRRVIVPTMALLRVLGIEPEPLTAQASGRRRAG